MARKTGATNGRRNGRRGRPPGSKTQSHFMSAADRAAVRAAVKNIEAANSAVDEHREGLKEAEHSLRENAKQLSVALRG